MTETVAVLGTGKMGTALARAFVAAGHSVVVWNRAPAKAEPLRTVATLASTPEIAARDSSIVVVSLTDYSACGGVLFSDKMGESLRGKTVVQLTSGTPSNARTGAEWAVRHGVHYLDCAILEAYYGGCLAFLHAAAICESEGISSSRFFEYKRSFVGAIDMTVDFANPMLEHRDYNGDQCSLDTHVGALAHIVSLSQEAGLDSRLPDTLYAVYAAASAAGLGAKELPAVYELLRGKRS
jgi:3-hydroxyisobutyrate dehydrogenase-like beta-hydroxyacid dehydrogenase